MNKITIVSQDQISELLTNGVIESSVSDSGRKIYIINHSEHGRVAVVSDFCEHGIMIRL